MSIDKVPSAGGSHSASALQSCQSIAIDADSSSEPATCRASSRSAGETGVCRITSARRAMARIRTATQATLTLRPGSDQIFTVFYGSDCYLCVRNRPISVEIRAPNGGRHSLDDATATWFT